MIEAEHQLVSLFLISVDYGVFSVNWAYVKPAFHSMCHPRF